MSNKLITISPKKTSVLKHHFGQNNMPMPYVSEIFLIECHIAGTSYVDVEEIEVSINQDNPLTFKREPHNKYDDLAIVVYDDSGNKLGYVPRDKNEILARLMDAGKLIYGKIKSKEWLNGWLKIKMDIYMRDL